MLHYPELVADCKPDIVAATAACQELKRSHKFGKLLEMILLIGNIMNTGSRNAQSVGFDISYLPKLSNTKDRDNKSTLLHFLVETLDIWLGALCLFAHKGLCTVTQRRYIQMADSCSLNKFYISVKAW